MTKLNVGFRFQPDSCRLWFCIRRDRCLSAKVYSGGLLCAFTLSGYSELLIALVITAAAVLREFDSLPEGEKEVSRPATRLPHGDDGQPESHRLCMPVNASKPQCEASRRIYRKHTGHLWRLPRNSGRHKSASC